jgi:hypothetical protein
VHIDANCTALRLQSRLMAFYSTTPIRQGIAPENIQDRFFAQICACLQLSVVWMPQTFTSPTRIRHSRIHCHVNGMLLIHAETHTYTQALRVPKMSQSCAGRDNASLPAAVTNRRQTRLRAPRSVPDGKCHIPCAWIRIFEVQKVFQKAMSAAGSCPSCFMAGGHRELLQQL